MHMLAPWMELFSSEFGSQLLPLQSHESKQPEQESQGLALEEKTKEKGTQTEAQTKDKETQTQTKEQKETEFQQTEDDYLFECYLKELGPGPRGSEENQPKQTKAKAEEPKDEKSESSSLLYSDPETIDLFDKHSWAWARDFEEGPGPSAAHTVDPHEALGTRPYHHLMLDPRNRVFQF